MRLRDFARHLLAIAVAHCLLFLDSAPAQAQAISVVSFECGGVATSDLGVGDVVTVTHSLDTTATFASALVQIPQPPNILISGVQSLPYVAGVPVTQVLPITTAPAPGFGIAFAVQFFGNFVAVDCPTYDADITKSVDIGSVSTLPTTLTYTIEVENTGTGNLDAPVLTENLSQGATALSPSSGPTVTSGDTDGDGVIDPGETFVYTVTYDVTQANMDDASDITNSADFTATFLPAITSNTVTTSINANPSISVSKMASQDTNVPANSTVTYTYVVTNNGNQTITGVSLSDVHGGSGPPPVPGNETLTADNGPIADSTDASSDGIWDTLAPGDEVTFTASYVVTQNDLDTLQ